MAYNKKKRLNPFGSSLYLSLCHFLNFDMLCNSALQYPFIFDFHATPCYAKLPLQFYCSGHSYYRSSTEAKSYSSFRVYNNNIISQRLMRRMWTWMLRSACMLGLPTPDGPHMVCLPRGIATPNLLVPAMSSWLSTMASSQTMRSAYFVIVILCNTILVYCLFYSV